MVLAIEQAEPEKLLEMSDSFFPLWITIYPPELFHRKQHRCVLVFQQEHQELRWRRRIWVATDGVNIVGPS